MFSHLKELIIVLLHFHITYSTYETTNNRR